MYYVMMRLNKDDEESYTYGKYETKEKAKEVRKFVENQRRIEVYIEEKE